MADMRALSIRQPWLHAILHGGKRVENRDWVSCNYRGPVLLHASKGCTRAEYAEAAMVIAGIDPTVVVPKFPDDLPRGGLAGIARIVDVERNSEEAFGWRVPGALGLLLADVRPLPFVPFKGSLGFFAVALHEQGPGFGTPHKQAYEAAWRELAAASRRAA